MQNSKQEKSHQRSFLTFKLGEEEYAVHVQNVLNILEFTKITLVPEAPDYMKGVINLRGDVLPVIDTRVKLGLSPFKYTDNTCIVVIEINQNGEKIYFGSLVDKVEAVHEISKEEVKSPTDGENIYKSRFIKGITSRNGTFIMLLDVEKLFDKAEIPALDENTELTES